MKEEKISESKVLQNKEVLAADDPSD